MAIYNRAVLSSNGKKGLWLARVHRKGLDLRPRLLRAQTTAFWKTSTYNRYIGISFSLGAFLFSLASDVSHANSASLRVNHGGSGHALQTHNLNP